MLYKVCGSCGRKVKASETCICRKERNKAYDREHRDQDRAAFYRSKNWKKATAACKARDAGLDAYELKVNKRIVRGDLSHHIIELSEAPNRGLDLTNLIYLSHATHNRVHKAYNSSEEAKKEMQAMLFAIIDGGEG